MKIFVAGNGPSLKDIDFEDLKTIEWMGMNAAYRYWDKINIYPTYYCCLDKVVVKEHADEIIRLLTEKKVKKAFLTNAILELYPHLDSFDNVYFLENILDSNLINKEIFTTKYSSKKTTGSWAIRFLIGLGYKEIYISGIDCNYVEVVSGAKLTGEGLELEIVDDTKENPNYFFADYQKKGDLYQIPNPESHFGNMHLQSLEAIAQDLRNSDSDIQIYNTAKNSNLFKYNVFEYMPPSQVFDKPLLEAVCIPTIKKELDNLLANFDLWDRAGYFPLGLNSKLFGKIDLHILFDFAQDDEIVEKINSKYLSTLYLKNVFKSIKITFLDIPIELNAYERDKNNVDVFRKIGPNIHFLMSMLQCKEYKYIFFMETDCTPIKQNWLEDINKYIVDNPDFLIAGSYAIPFLDTIDPSLGLHINGNALYATGHNKFKPFLEDVLIPSLFYLMIDLKDRHIAYDCVISKILSLGLSLRVQRDLGKKYDKNLEQLFMKLLNYSSLIRSCPLIINSTLDDSKNNIELQVDKLNTSIIHNRDYNNKIISMMKKSSSLKALDISEQDYWYKNKFLNSHSVNTGTTLYAYHNYNNRKDIEFKFIDYSRNFIILTQNANKVDKDKIEQGPTVVFDSHGLVKGDTIGLLLKIEVEKDITMKFKFARQFDGVYCQTIKTVLLKKGIINDISLELKLKDKYRALRLEFIAEKLISIMTVNYTLNVKNATLPHRDNKDKVTVCKKLDDVKNIPILFKNNISNLPWLKTKYNAKVDKKLELPKVLILDFTLLGSNSATGQIKETLFANWGKEKIFQVYLHGNNLRGCYPKNKESKIFVNGIVDEINKFNYDVIYFRLTDHRVMYDFYHNLKNVFSKFTITHLMDDWPKRLKTQGVETYDYFDREVRKIINLADVNLSICDEMSAEYEKRYGIEFKAIANGANLSKFPAKQWKNRPKIDKNNPITIRYMGGLAEDMCLKSVQSFAKIISNVSLKYPVRFEIYTMDWYFNEAKSSMGVLDGVEVYKLVDKDKYPDLLSSSDMLLAAYNFDEITLSYLGFSFANKLPEILAVGVPVIAIGPKEIPTISYFSKLDFVNTISNSDFKEEDIAMIIHNLFFDKLDITKLKKIAIKSREHVSKYLSEEVKQNDFQKCFDISKIKKKSVNLSMNIGIDSFKTANRLFREGKYREAYNIYQKLYDKEKLGLYKISLDNAKRKLDKEN